MTFERILVPLDGSRLAEASLPAAVALARRLGSVLVLVHALEANPPVAIHDEPHLASFDDARAYLEHHRQRCSALGLSVEVHIARAEVDDVAIAIDELAETLDTGLIVMCAHGRHMLRGRLLGRIAESALRAGTATILLRTDGAAADVPFDVRRILMPIDFRHDVHAAMDAVRALAGKFGATVTLLNAAEPEGGLQTRLLPAATSMVRDLDRDRARERLTELAVRLRVRGIDVDIAVRQGPPEDAIIEEARTPPADLIVLVTHGRAGVSAWYERSIRRRMVEEPGLTLLLFRQR